MDQDLIADMDANIRPYPTAHANGELVYWLLDDGTFTTFCRWRPRTEHGTACVIYLNSQDSVSVSKCRFQTAPEDDSYEVSACTPEHETLHAPSLF